MRWREFRVGEEVRGTNMITGKDFEMWNRYAWS